MKNDTIRVLPDQLLTTIELRRTTALADCTQITTESGRHAMTRNWPGFSTGQELLWQIAEWLNESGPRPSWGVLREGLDVANLAAVAALLDDEGLRDADLQYRLGLEMERARGEVAL